MYFRTIFQIKKANETCGQNWFSAYATKKLSLVVNPTVYGGKFFIASICPESDLFLNQGRRYSIYQCASDGWISAYAYGEDYPTLRDAETALFEKIKFGSGIYPSTRPKKCKSA